MAANASPGTSRDALQRLFDGLQTLIKEHLALARVEAQEDARQMGRDLLLSAAGVPALAAGYLLLLVAVALLLAQWLPAWAAFGVVAVVNLVAGAALSVVFGRRATASRPRLPNTRAELQRDRTWVSQLKDGTAPRADETLPVALPVPPQSGLPLDGRRAQEKPAAP